MQTVMIADSAQTWTLIDVADELIACGELEIADDEKRGDERLEDGRLVVDILYDQDDPRVDGTRKREVAFTLEQIRKAFTNAEYLTWGKDEDGLWDILICFGCC